MATPPTVAIACQGGGSHAAFAAGALSALLNPEHRERYRLVGLSGTSGGAMCAALAWAGLIRGGPAEARRRLLEFWRDLEVHDLLDAAVNAWSVWLARLPVTAEVSPYLYEPAAEPQLRALLRRHLDLDSLPADPRRRRRSEAAGGRYRHRQRPRRRVRGRDADVRRSDRLGRHPASLPGRARARDALLGWAVHPEPTHPRAARTCQSGPTRYGCCRSIHRAGRTSPEPSARSSTGATSSPAISHSARRPHFVEKINELLAKHSDLATRYKPIGVRVVELDLVLDYTSKFDRSGPLIERLLEHGRKRAAWFFEDRSRWPRQPAPTAAASGVVR